jgi:hypothetical protein
LKQELTSIKIPKSKYEKTVSFYRDILKLEVEEKPLTIQPASPQISDNYFSKKYSFKILFLRIMITLLFSISGYSHKVGG